MNVLSARSPEIIDETQSLGRHWFWFLAIGLLFAFLGVLALTRAYLPALTIKATWLFGLLLLAGGIGEIVGSFRAGRWSGTLFHILIGLLYVIVGLLIMDQPETSAVQITLVFSIFMILVGAFKIFFSLIDRFTGWGWVLLNGVATLILGLMIYKQWPVSGTWVIGLFLGIELIISGWTWMMLALNLRQAKRAQA